MDDVERDKETENIVRENPDSRERALLRRLAYARAETARYHVERNEAYAKFHAAEDEIAIWTKRCEQLGTVNAGL